MPRSNNIKALDSLWTGVYQVRTWQIAGSASPPPHNYDDQRMQTPSATVTVWEKLKARHGKATPPVDWTTALHGLASIGGYLSMYVCVLCTCIAERSVF